MNHSPRPRFIFHTAEEVWDCLDDIRYMDDIEPEREQWIKFRKIVERSISKITFPAHLKDVSAVIYVDWQDWLQDDWQARIKEQEKEIQKAMAEAQI